MSRLFLAGVAVSLVFHVIALPVEAAVFEVDRFDDPFPSQNCASGVDVDCSLREAVITANNTAGPDLIIIPAGTFNLTRSGTPENASVSGDLDLAEAVRIEGAGMTATIIDGGGPGVLNDRIIDILGVEVEIEGLTIRGGSGVTNGGGLYNRSGSTLTLTETMITANQADTVAGWAGGMQTAGICTLIFSVVHDNEASRAGGIDASGTTIIQDSWISDNRALEASSDWSGGGILTFQSGSSTTLIRTTVSGNTSASYGGGLHAYGPTTIVDSTFESNHSAKFGGAISVAPSRTVTIEKSAFFWNTSDADGGAIGVEDLGTLDITNSTIDSNHAGKEGGAIAVEGVASLINVTIGRNTAITATAVINSPTSNVTYHNTIFEGSCSSAVQVTSLGGNIESPGNTCQLTARSDQFNVTSMALDLGPLGYFGGSTATRLPLPGSVAIDAADGCPTSFEDQRGTTRPIDGDGIGGAICDVGSVEVLLNEEPWLFEDGFETGDTFGWSSTVP